MRSFATLLFFLVTFVATSAEAARHPVAINRLRPTELPRIFCEIRDDDENRLVKVRQQDEETALVTIVSLPDLRKRMRSSGTKNRIKLKQFRRIQKECRAGYESEPPGDDDGDSDDQDDPSDNWPPDPDPDGDLDGDAGDDTDDDDQQVATDENCIDGLDNDLDEAVDDEDTDCQFVGRTFYFSSDVGNDAWSGLLPTPNTDLTDGPKRTLAAANTIVRTVAEPGDRVLLRRGDSWIEHGAASNTFSLSNIEGTLQAPIVLGAYGSATDKPRLDIGGTLANIISVTGSTKYLLVRDLHLTTTAPLGQRPQGINVIDCSGDDRPEHVVFDGLVIDNLRYGVTLQSNNLTLRNSVIRNNFKSGELEQGGHTQGLYVGKQCGGGNHITVTDNIFDNNGAMESVFDWNAYLSCIHCSFERNYVTAGSAGLKLRNCIDIKVRDNIFEDINSVGISVGSDNDRPAEDILIERNVIRGTVDGITVTRQSTGEGIVKNVTIINNILMNNLPRLNGGGDYNGYMLYSANEPRENVLIAHNTFFNIRFKSPLSLNLDGLTDSEPNPQVNVRIMNNLIHGSDPDYPAIQFRGDVINPITFNNNLYDTYGIMQVRQGPLHQSLAAVRQQFPDFETQGIEGEAGLKEEQSSIGPLAILTGAGDGVNAAPCLTEVGHDFFENIRPATACDVGAEER